MTKNIGKSIKTRLLNLARDEKHEYMKVLVRYLHECLLYRISVSTFKNRKTTYHDGLKLFTDDFATNPPHNARTCNARCTYVRWAMNVRDTANARTCVFG